jgi:hypothetical protein
MLHENILRIRDENSLGEIYHELTLSFSSIEVSVLDIITERVRDEVLSYSRKAADSQNHALVQPTEVEKRLNQNRMRNQAEISKKIDIDKQIDIALKAFHSNGFFILIDDVQAEELEQLVTIKPDTTVSFIKLTPLVGG